MMKKQQSFVAGALILTVTALLVRFSGFLFRIFLSNTIGAQGMGIYSLIMSVYGLCTTIATSGIGVAVSRLVAEQLSLGNPANARRVLRRSVELSLLLGCAVAAVLLLASEFIAVSILGEARTLLSLRLLAPGLPFIAVSSCFRGYFIAVRRAGNPASGQVLEQMFKIVFIVLFLDKWIPLGLEYACAWVVLGLTLGEAVCFLYTFAGFLMQRKREAIRQRADMPGALRQILDIIVPISAASYIRSGLRLFENVLTMNALRAFSGRGDEAMSTFGMLKGMAMPLLLFPLGLLSSFVITLTPEVSRLNATGRKIMLKSTVSRILQYTCYAGILIVCIFMTFPSELGEAFYKDPRVGGMLYTLSFLSPFMCLEMVVVGILQGLGEQLSSTRYNVADCFLRIALVWALIPVMGVTGFIWMTVASNLFTSILNLRRLLKVTSVSFRVREWLVRPGIAAAATGQIVKAMYKYGLFAAVPGKAGLFLGIMAACLAYLILLVLLDCVHPGDMNWIRERLRRTDKIPGKSDGIADN